MQSNGGVASFAAARASAADAGRIRARPAASPARCASAQALGERDILYLDIGGTTAKCSLIRDGRPVTAAGLQARMERLDPGYPVQVPVVDIVEIGAGGGSIARVDDTGGCQGRPAERRRRSRARLLRARRRRSRP